MSDNQNRRQFLKMMSAGSLLCFGCGHLCASPQTDYKSMVLAGKEKWQDDSKMSFERVFNFTYENIILKIRLLADIMGKDMGREKFLDYLEEAAKKSGEVDAEDYAKKLGGKRDLKTYATEFREPDYLVSHILTFKILQDTDKVFESKITNCLWAKTFQKYGIPDIGAAMFCNRDFATAKAFNPKIQLYRTKTIMKGDDHCNHRWVYEE